MGGMDFDSTHEQDEASRFFLPDIDPEVVGWPEDNSMVAFLDDGYDYEGYQDLYADFHPTHYMDE